MGCFANPGSVLVNDGGRTVANLQDVVTILCTEEGLSLVVELSTATLPAVMRLLSFAI